MVLQEQRTTFPISKGLGLGTQEDYAQAPAALIAHNLEFTREGELQKRPGWFPEAEYIIGANYLPALERLATRGDEILWIGEQVSQKGGTAREPLHILSRIPGEAAELPGTNPVWKGRATLPRFTSTVIRHITHNWDGSDSYSLIPKIQDFDIAIAGHENNPAFSLGVICVIWGYRQSGTATRLDYACIDVATRGIIHQGILATDLSGISGKSRPIRVIATYHNDGDWWFHVFYPTGDWSGGTGAFQRLDISAASPTAIVGPTFLGNWNNLDVVCTGPTCPDPNYNFQTRVFASYCSSGSGSLTFAVYTAESGGSLQFRASASVSITSVASTTIYPRSVHLVCEPRGSALLAHFVTIAPGCVGTPYNIAMQVGCSDASAYTISSHSDIIVESGSASTGDDILQAGCHCGWAGQTAFLTNKRWDSWWLSWARGWSSNIDHVYNARYAYLEAGLAPIAIWGSLKGSTASMQCWGRHFNYQGQNYFMTIRGKSTDAVTVEVHALLAGGAIGAEGYGDPALTYRIAGRALGGQIALPNTGYGEYPMQRGKNSIVESLYQPGRFFTVVPTVTNDNQLTMLTLIDFDARDPQRFNYCEINGSTFLSGSVTWNFDGYYGHEIGFPHRPQYTGANNGEIGIILTTTGTGWAAGDYFFALTWESVGSDGRKTISAPSMSGRITIAANNIVTLKWDPVGLTTHRNCHPVLYVSNDNGKNYIRSQQILSGYESNDVLSAVIDPVKLFQPDQPNLYTDSGILPHDPPPSARFVCQWQNRVWLACGTQAWYSAEVIEGEDPWFSGSWIIPFQDDICGMVALDDRLVFFTEYASNRQIYWVSGDGPTDTGDGGSFTMPQRIPTNFGCVDARSIRRVDRGVVYLSERGFELLGSDMQTVWISQAIYPLLLPYTQCIDSVWDPERQVVKWVMTNSAGQYKIFCWNTAFNEWTTESIPSVSGDAHLAVNPGGIVRAFNRLWIGLSDDSFSDATPPRCMIAQQARMKENPIWLDGTGPNQNYYSTTYYTAFLATDGLDGFVRVRRLILHIKSSNSCGVQLNYAIDGGSDNHDARQWRSLDDISSSAIDSTSEHYRFGIHIDDQKCSSIQLQFGDMPAEGLTVPNNQFTLVGVTMVWGRRPGSKRGHERSTK